MLKSHRSNSQFYQLNLKTTELLFFIFFVNDRAISQAAGKQITVADDEENNAQ